VAFIDVVFYFFDVVQFEINFDKQEGNVHLFAYFDSLFKGEIVCFDGLIIKLMVVVNLGFVKKGVSNFGLSEVFLGVLDLSVGFGDKLVESLLDLHGYNFKFFLNLGFIKCFALNKLKNIVF
jgi:hypothetical protein